MIVGLFCALLVGCQATSPEEVTTNFWQSLAQGQLENAKKLTSDSSKHLVSLTVIDPQSTIKIGEIVADDVNATVETTIIRMKGPVTFKTVLLKENDNWKVDYQQTRMNLSMLPFDAVVKSLQNLGDTVANELEQSAPLIEKEIQSLGNEFRNQIEEFSKNLKKPGNTSNHPNNASGI